ncbi:MAG TPA: hypothetical protein VK642_10230 [Burkholderiales bacterium]|nr:hypothetical protein [Burkholderiales bacterium]
MARRIQYLVIAAMVLGTGFGLTGCKKEAPPPPPPPAAAPAPKVEAPPPAPVVVSVTNITLGKAIGADKKVTAATDTFAKGDTIYAAVETTGSGNADLKAKWTFIKGDKVADVSDSAETIAASGPAVTSFKVSKPSGWPPGDYQVEISLNGKSVGTKKFSVK